MLHYERVVLNTHRNGDCPAYNAPSYPFYNRKQLQCCHMPYHLNKNGHYKIPVASRDHHQSPNTAATTTKQLRGCGDAQVSSYFLTLRSTPMHPGIRVNHTWNGVVAKVTITSTTRVGPSSKRPYQRNSARRIPCINSTPIPRKER
jgi:hypothetical protein